MPYSNISSLSFCQELLAHGFEPFSIPVLSFKFDNQQELTQKLEEPSKYGGTAYKPNLLFTAGFPLKRCQARGGSKIFGRGGVWGGWGGDGCLS